MLSESIGLHSSVSPHKQYEHLACFSAGLTCWLIIAATSAFGAIPAGEHNAAFLLRRPPISLEVVTVSAIDLRQAWPGRKPRELVAVQSQCEDVLGLVGLKVHALKRAADDCESVL